MGYEEVYVCVARVAGGDARTLPRRNFLVFPHYRNPFGNVIFHSIHNHSNVSLATECDCDNEIVWKLLVGMTVSAGKIVTDLYEHLLSTYLYTARKIRHRAPSQTSRLTNESCIRSKH